MTYKEYMQLGLDKCPANKAVEEIRKWTKANDGRSSIVVLMDKAQSYTRGTISGNNPVACLALEMTTDENFRELIYKCRIALRKNKERRSKNQIRIKNLGKRNNYEYENDTNGAGNGKFMSVCS